MSLEDLTKKELLELGDQFGVELKPQMSKENIVTELQENGVTFDFVKKNKELVDQENELDADLEVEEPPKKKLTRENSILMLMTRKNPTFEVLGYRFTKEHPFAVVSEDDADEIMSLWEGFRPATPNEVREYYK